MGMRYFWHLLFVVLLEEALVFTPERVCILQSLVSFQSLSNADCAFCWVAYFRKCHKRFEPKSVRHDQWDMFVKNLFATDMLVLQLFLKWLCLYSFSCYHYPTVFPNFVFHALCSCLDVFFYRKEPVKFCRSKFQQVGTHAFCSWDDIFPTTEL